MKLWKLLPCLAALAACSQGPLHTDIRAVSPTTVEEGEKLVIETTKPLKLDEPVTVELYGWFETPGKPGVERKVLLRNARTTAPGDTGMSTRVLVDIDSLVKQELGGHTIFQGALAITQGVTRLERKERLDFFPKTARSLAYRIAGGHATQGLVAWLGIQAHPEARSDRKALLVSDVRDAFSGIKFIADFDCGIWDATANTCSAPLDAKVDTGEAFRGGVDPSFFAQLDVNADGSVDRAEAERNDRTASAAAVAGVRRGDLITSAQGRPISSLGDLVDAWDGEHGEVRLDLLRPSADGTYDELSVVLPRYGRPASFPRGLFLAGVLLAIGLLVVLPVPVVGGIIVVWERKLAGRMQSRPGPNRVGPSGWLQWLADGIKLITKEDIIPKAADPYLFVLAPYLVFIGVFGTFVVLPFSQLLIAADLNVGVLYVVSITSLVVVGIIMGGWASNSKWSLLGGMRAAAQIISYELPASVAILSVVVLSGTLSTQGIVENQGGAPWNWHLFDNPFTFLAFFIYFISALAEGNRTPFDLPEAESELVAGFNTEYSGFRFAIFPMTEWVNLIVIAAVVTTVFLGGWRIPGVSSAAIEVSLGLQLLSGLVFAIKATALIFVIIWIRWTLPRFRVDQMMVMCWKYLLPISLVALVAVAAWVWIAPYPSLPRKIVRLATFAGGGLGTLGYFATRVNLNRKSTKVLELRGA